MTKGTTTMNETSERERIAKRVANTAPAWGERAIGREIAVRTGPNTVIRGTVAAVKFDRVAWRGRTCRAIFKVDVKFYGSTNIEQHRIVSLSRLP